MNYDIKGILEQHKQVIQVLLEDEQYFSDIEHIIKRSADAILQGGKLLFCGNGGSASDAQHISAELTGRFSMERRALPAIALHENTSHLTAVANDYGYHRVYSRMIEALANKGDVLFALSTSGNSENILEAIREAKNRSVYIIGMTGRSGGKMKELTDQCICIPSEETARIQEMHIMTGHIICEGIEREIFGNRI